MSRPRAFDLQGHRGARGLAPENTLVGFARALAVGISTLELDVGVSADGVVVIAHDRRLNPDITRGPDGRWLEEPTPAVHALTYAELQRYDVGRIRPGSAYARRFPEQQPYDGARIPRLADLFALVERAGNRSVRFNIETKCSPLAPQETPPPEAFAAALVTVVRAARMQARVTVQSFDWRTLLALRRLAPEIATSCLTAEQPWLDNVGRGRAEPSPWLAGLELRAHRSLPRLAKAAGAAIWSPYHAELRAEDVREAHALGLAVLPWTVNDPDDMRRAIELGADGLITDRPDLARAAMAARGMPLPPPSPVEP
jgi:glycerophosphoryl diester phosphodiesterase